MGVVGIEPLGRSDCHLTRLLPAVVAGKSAILPAWTPSAAAVPRPSVAMGSDAFRPVFQHRDMLEAGMAGSTGPFPACQMPPRKDRVDMWLTRRRQHSWIVGSSHRIRAVWAAVEVALGYVEENLCRPVGVVPNQGTAPPLMWLQVA